MATDGLGALTPSRRNRMLLLIFGTGAAIGLHLGLINYVLVKRWTATAVFVASSVGFSGITYALWAWVFPRLGGKRLVNQVIRQTVVALLIFSGACVAIAEISAWFSGSAGLFGQPAGDPVSLTITPEDRQRMGRMFALLPVVPSAVLSLIAYHQVWRHVRSLERRQQELTELAATAQLAALRAQINPHFLFNSLNSIAQLIRSDPDKAEGCVERLAEIFRYVTRTDQELVPLSEELQIAQAYLEIERARFDGLRIETDVDPRSLPKRIPHLLIQPLVENAVKHGTSRKLGAGTVSIKTRVVGDELRLTIDDDGVGMTAPALQAVYSRGVGLRNLRDRLMHLYGPDHVPEITSAPGAGTTVRVRLPMERVEAAA
jgi:signal transduction histidine kinase